jgi:hypothetical protein
MVFFQESYCSVRKYFNIWRHLTHMAWGKLNVQYQLDKSAKECCCSASMRCQNGHLHMHASRGGGLAKKA